MRITSAGILRVAWKNQSCGRVRKYCAMTTGGEERGTEGLVFAAVVVSREVRFPSHTIIQRQPRGDLPVILDIQRIVELPRVESVDRTLRQGRRKTQHIIAQDQSRIL